MTNQEINKQFLSATDAKTRDEVLSAVAGHYGITKAEALDEVTHEEAEHLLDSDRSRSCGNQCLDAQARPCRQLKGKTVLDAKYIKMLQRLRKGDCPRCSRADFEKLRAVLPGYLQLESAHGARGSMSLTYLHDRDSTNAAIDKLLDAIGQTQTSDFVNGYYCAVAVALREEGTVTRIVQSMFDQGGSPEQANAEDIALFRQYGLMQ